MSRTTMFFRQLSFSTMLLLTAFATVSAQSHYRLKDTGGLGNNGVVAGVLSSINNKGQAAGQYVENAENSHFRPFVFDGTRLTFGQLIFPYGYNWFANGINDAGQMVGSYSNGGSPFPFAYLNIGQMVNGFGNYEGELFGINASGQYCGTMTDGTFPTQAYFSGSQTFLPNLPGRNAGDARALNDDGLVAGDTYNTGDSINRAVYWDAQQAVHDLGTLPGDNGSVANGINAAGQIVGNSHPSGIGATYHAFIYALPNGPMQALGTLGVDSNAKGINKWGVAVGNSNTAAGYQNQHACVYKNGTVLDLNAPGVVIGRGNIQLADAVAINDRGQIACNGDYNLAHGYLLTPIVTPYDFNGDGKSDLIWQDSGSGTLNTVVWNMDGTTATSSTTVLPANGLSLSYRLAGSGDINGDGIADFVWQDQNTNETYLWFWNGSTFTPKGIVPPKAIATVYHVIGLADVTGDGIPDLLWHDGNSGNVIYWQLQTSGVPSGGGVLYGGLGVNWQLVGNGDFDGSGTTQLLWQDQATNQVVRWRLANRAVVSSDTLVNAEAVPITYRMVGCPDLDGDGQPDLLWQNQDTGALTVWYMVGTTYRSAATIAGSSGSSYRVVGMH